MKEEYYKIEKPDISLNPFKSNEEFESVLRSTEMQDIIQRVQKDYLSWEKLKNKSWVSDKGKKVWIYVKMLRYTSNQASVISDKEDKKFNFNPRGYVEFLHRVDLELGGNAMGIRDFSDIDKRNFVKRSLIEEAIASSQLEGANTSRQAAKRMLKEGRKPKNQGEKMIFNNHNAMKWIEEDLKNEELSIELLKDLHKRVTLGTMGEDESKCGVFRETLDKNGDPLVIRPFDNNDMISYVTPDKEFVEIEINKFIDFANDNDNSGFIHPLIKAIMLHFWIGLLHPFEDGNGRLARIIFYWYMLRKGYWVFSYISLSEFILKSNKQYAMAYINSEQDDNDLGYFIHYNISKLKLARKSFQKYIERKVLENKQHIRLVKSGYNLNSRQAKLLRLFFEKELEFTTSKEYCLSNNIGRLTANFDFKKMVEDGFLERRKIGRNVFYYSTSKIKELFK